MFKNLFIHGDLIHYGIWLGFFFFANLDLKFMSIAFLVVLKSSNVHVYLCVRVFIYTVYTDLYATLIPKGLANHFTVK